MNPTINRKLNEIRNRYKDQVTKKPAFKNDNEVKDFAVELLYDQLKKERLILKAYSKNTI